MLFQPCFEAGERHEAHLLLFLAAGVGRERRQDRLARLGHVGAALGDHQRVVASLGQIGEEQPHLGRRFEIMLAGQTAAVRIRERDALLDAEQHVMRLLVARIGEERIVGGDQRQIVRIGEIDEIALDALLLRHAVAHQLDIEPAAEKRGKLQQHRLGGWLLPFGEQPPHRATRSAGQSQQPVAMAFEHGDIDLRLLAATGLEKRLADQLQEIAIARLILHQQDDHVGRQGRTNSRGESDVFHIRAPQPELAADDRLHSRSRPPPSKIRASRRDCRYR